MRVEALTDEVVETKERTAEFCCVLDVFYFSQHLCRSATFVTLHYDPY